MGTLKWVRQSSGNLIARLGDHIALEIIRFAGGYDWTAYDPRVRLSVGEGMGLISESAAKSAVRRWAKSSGAIGGGTDGITLKLTEKEANALATLLAHLDAGLTSWDVNTPADLVRRARRIGEKLAVERHALIKTQGGQEHIWPLASSEEERCVGGHRKCETKICGLHDGKRCPFHCKGCTP